MYDLEKLSWVIAERRKKFKIFLAVYSFVFIFGCILFLLEDKNVKFSGIILVIVAVALLAKLVRRYSPSVLFSKEKQGILVKEHEYVASVARGLSARRTFVRTTAAGHSSAGNARSKRPHIRSAYVYIKDANGDVIILDGLTSLHTDIYEIGDELLRPSGARYPFIAVGANGRKVDKQPCPLCGRINSPNDESCNSCGLSIIKRR